MAPPSTCWFEVSVGNAKNLSDVNANSNTYVLFTRFDINQPTLDKSYTEVHIGSPYKSISLSSTNR